MLVLSVISLKTGEPERTAWLRDGENVKARFYNETGNVLVKKRLLSMWSTASVTLKLLLHPAYNSVCECQRFFIFLLADRRCNAGIPGDYCETAKYLASSHGFGKPQAVVFKPCQQF